MSQRERKVESGIRTSWLAVALLLLTGCRFGSSDEAVVYVALDREFSEPHFFDFEEVTGVTIAPKYDTEANKTVGLTAALLAEKERPRCDVFWNNEVLNTLRLEKAGLLDAYIPPNAEDFPQEFRSPDGTWYGFASRARVLLVNTDLVKEEDFPTSIQDLVDPKWKGQCGFAKPLFGTTATHAAVLFSVWEADKAEAFFTQLKENGRMFPGNKQVAVAVGSGQIAFGWTDTDDAKGELRSGAPVAIVYPDQAEGELGTLFIPNTLAILRGCPHPEAARKLVDFLLQPQVETALAAGPSAQIPLNAKVAAPASIETPQTKRAMQVDFRAAADKWDEAASYLTPLFLTQ
ncbi:extracellular solute-binding protein [Blastopirellula retiformator]|uniref:Putative binding protein component of ABC iron transporter n=1 Tax=Blastopirellula retiformator TaxID=2527970 RepID=A0A5C5VKZ9_9BACT|nr:extracellular solute-binding protein [Blastopirellula retiformator]TWT38590.1 putative binding protein component of ABC iron transporter precursor [Blastopirellula retiformator]